MSMSKILRCPHETADSKCEIHQDFPDRFPEICHGPKQCFGKNYKKQLEAMQPTDECLFGVVKSKNFKDESCRDCEQRKNCPWKIEEKPKRVEKTKSKKVEAQPSVTLFDYMEKKDSK